MADEQTVSTEQLFSGGSNTVSTSELFGSESIPQLKSSHPPIDYNRLSMALVSSHVMGISPGTTYQQQDTINSELTKRDPTIPTSTASIADDMRLGWENSIFGLAYRGQMPETVGTQSRFDKIITGLTQMVADMPVYLAGSTIGGYAGAAFGSAVPVVGTTAGAIGGAAAGTFRIPEAIRESLTLGIQKGEIKNFRDLMERTLDTFYAGEKGALTGLVVGKAGEFTPSLSKALGPASKAAESALKISQQAAALTILPNVCGGR